ncbi:MAG: 3',5'-cyclic-nucleotide phosphodiesterase [Thermoanaerobaculia bacterium]|nr:3',5'-cyclic-nucleotide phosphodiesterase [Thermoanaerobaculia bacterium]
MRIRVLGAYGGSTPWHRQTSFLLDGTVTLDAGALTQSLTLEEQARVRSIIVTHSHLDHVASLPFLVENVFSRTEGPIEVVATEDVAALLQAHLFNDAIWPDFTRIPNHLLPAVTFRVVEAGVPFRVNGLHALAVPVSHVVPTYGYLVWNDEACVVFSSDTGPTEALWAEVRRRADLKAIFVECSFPDSMSEIAEVSRHLTPRTLREEMRKFPASVPVNLYHMKPPTLPALRADVAALAEPRLRILDDGDELEF